MDARECEYDAGFFLTVLTDKAERVMLAARIAMTATAAAKCTSLALRRKNLGENF